MEENDVEEEAMAGDNDVEEESGSVIYLDGVLPSDTADSDSASNQLVDVSGMQQFTISHSSDDVQEISQFLDLSRRPLLLNPSASVGVVVYNAFISS